MRHANPYPSFGSQYGYYSDSETALELLGYRYYDPAQGRFLNRDPIGMSGGMNVYTYVGNDPAADADPTGLWAISIGATAIGFLPIGAALWGGAQCTIDVPTGDIFITPHGGGGPGIGISPSPLGPIPIAGALSPDISISNGPPLVGPGESMVVGFVSPKGSAQVGFPIPGERPSPWSVGGAPQVFPSLSTGGGAYIGIDKSYTRKIGNIHQILPAIGRGIGSILHGIAHGIIMVVGAVMPVG